MTKDALVAQLDRALPSEGRGHRFESCRVHHFSYIYQQINALLLLQCSKVLTLLQSVVKFYIESKIAQAQGYCIRDSYNFQLCFLSFEKNYHKAFRYFHLPIAPV